MEYEFTLFIRADLSDDETIGRLLAAGCDDAIFGGSTKWGTADFSRESSSFGAAITSAICAVESALPHSVIAVEPIDLVSMSTIAERLDRTYESVRLLATGQRGDGSFPAPADIPNIYGVQLWRWSEILRWSGQADESVLVDAATIVAVNAYLELRAVTPILGDLTMKELHQAIPA